MLENFIKIVQSIPLAYVIIVMAVLAGVLLLILSFNIAFPARRVSLSRFRDKREGLPDRLQYGAVIDDGIIVNKDGSLMASFVVEAADIASQTIIDRETNSDRLNDAFMSLGSGWVIHFDSARRTCPVYSDRDKSHFPDPVSRAIDEERREYFTASGALYEGQMVMTVTYYPPRQFVSKMTEMMYESKETKVYSDADKTRQRIDDFRRELENLQSRMSSVFKLKHLRSYSLQSETQTHTYDDQLSWIHYCLTGQYIPVLFPKSLNYVDYLIGGYDFYAGIIPSIGPKYIQVVSIINFPAESAPGILNALSTLPCEYRWNTRFIFLDTQDALARMEKDRRIWKQQERGIIDVIMNNVNGRVNQFAVDNRLDIEEMITETQKGYSAVGYYNSSVVLMSEDLDELRKAALFVQKTLGDLGFPAQIETVNNMDAFFGTLPGHCYENIRQPIINTQNLADLLPCSTIWTGEDKCPCPFYPPDSPALLHAVTSGYTPFRLNLHVRDLGHTLIMGPTGAGKSVLLATLAAQYLRYQNMTVYSFDIGNSMFTLCKSVGGQHYDIAGEEVVLYDDKGNPIGQKPNYAFCPLQFLDSKTEIAWAQEWVETLCELNNLVLKPEHKKAISDCLETMSKSTANLRSLNDFHTQVGSLEVKDAISSYVGNGMMAYMLAADHDDLHLASNGGMCVFEVGALMGMGRPEYNLPVLDYLFHRIERSLTGQPTVIFIDEAWAMFRHPVFCERIIKWLKTMRKNNCAVVMATQTLSDVRESKISDTLKEATATKIFLPNPQAKHEETAVTYQNFGLNSQQIRVIAEAQQKREYYYTSEYGNRLFNLALGKLALAVLAVSDKDSIAAVKKLISIHGDSPEKWLPYWLDMQGVDPNIVWPTTHFDVASARKGNF